MDKIDLNINNYTLNDLLKLFKLSNNLTEEDLKNVKKQVLKTHPDKSNLPNDYFRFTHEGLIALFSEFCDLEILINGYDTNMRRVNWQGDDDGSYVKEDTFGAWRENWFSVLVAKIKNKKL